jgi:hypothetical protein
MIWSTQVKNGFSIDLISLFVIGTYDGLLEGRPNEELNTRFVQRAISSAQEKFGSWPVHLIPPKIRNGKHPELPNFRCIGLFQASATKDPDMHASGCVLVWFQEKTVVDGIELSLVDIDWWTIAKDFEY